MRRIPQNLGTLEQDRLYNIADLVKITELDEGIIRNRVFRYRPKFTLVNGIMHYTGEVARDFLTHRKSGKKN